MRSSRRTLVPEKEPRPDARAEAHGSADVDIGPGIVGAVDHVENRLSDDRAVEGHERRERALHTAAERDLVRQRATVAIDQLDGYPRVAADAGAFPGREIMRRLLRDVDRLVRGIPRVDSLRRKAQEEILTHGHAWALEHG